MSVNQGWYGFGTNSSKQFKIKVSDVKLAIEKISGVEVITENIKL